MDWRLGPERDRRERRTGGVNAGVLPCSAAMRIPSDSPVAAVDAVAGTVPEVVVRAGAVRAGADAPGPAMGSAPAFAPAAVPLARPRRNGSASGSSPRPAISSPINSAKARTRAISQRVEAHRVAERDGQDTAYRLLAGRGAYRPGQRHRDARPGAAAPGLCLPARVAGGAGDLVLHGDDAAGTQRVGDRHVFVDEDAAPQVRSGGRADEVHDEPGHAAQFGDVLVPQVQHHDADRRFPATGFDEVEQQGFERLLEAGPRPGGYVAA